ncbi:MAG: hypothetical protein HN589_03760 [Proteobacteria bacterium]|jgi:hypothetical protein|nr:hypothetical protein [Pseudomonadota bacterium]|tara:strand:+ start:1435 stop:1785 length:351 start_codon:yes stop_codon:yes gene_type:complete
MSKVKSADYLSQGGRIEFYLDERTVLKILSRLGFSSLVIGVLNFFPGIYFWGDWYCTGATGKYWDMCSGGTVGMWGSGLLSTFYFFGTSIGLYYSAMLLENLIGIRDNTEKENTSH